MHCVTHRAILVGDSIRLDYQPLVQPLLADILLVSGPAGNGGNSRELLADLDARAIRANPAVVHMNCGLHDIKREPGSNATAVPIAEYEDNLSRIFSRLQRETSARLVWATTTPVDDARHAAHKPFGRRLADVVAYNAVACRVARDCGIAVNDLYAVVMAAGADRLLLPDGVHFTPDGRRVLAEAVAGCIRDLWSRRDRHPLRV